MSKLEYHGGNGYDGLSEYGKYEVVYSKREIFINLSKARALYDSLNEDKALWDINRVPELLECHILS